MPRDLLTAILDEEARNVHYFNGRVLYAEDLAKEQAAHRHRLERLGRLAGEGVAWGLQVELAEDGAVPRTVTVHPGVAVNPRGQVLHLTQEVDLAVAGDVAPPEREDALFEACGGKTAVPDGLGPYVLLVGPASEYSERVPHVGIGDDGVSRGCGRRFVVEGVQFRLVHLDVEDGLPVPDTLFSPLRKLMLKATLSEAEESRLRNLLAHWCLGTAAAPGAYPRDLYGLVQAGGTVRYGPVDALRQAGEEASASISDCEVPLALLYWSGTGIRYVDPWAVRRSLTRASTASGPLGALAERRRAESEAAFFQFQAQLATLATPDRSITSLSVIRAGSYFRYLPPVGLVPERAGGFGLTYLEFFQTLTYRRPVFVHEARVPALIEEARAFPPVDLHSGELIWLYRVRSNREPRNGGEEPQPFLLFTSGQLPYMGDAQFDLAYWNYANYGPGVEPAAETE